MPTPPPSQRRNPSRSARPSPQALSRGVTKTFTPRKSLKSRNRPPHRAMSAASHEAARRFFLASQYAVAGASQDTKKYGYKHDALNNAVLAWYHAHGLPVHPINPRVASIQVPAPSAASSATAEAESTSYPTYAAPSALPSPASTSLSVVTPPAATQDILRGARDAGIAAVWLQPGSFDAETEALARALFPSVLAGEERLVGGEGWCVLLHGEVALHEAQKAKTDGPAGEKGRI